MVLARAYISLASRAGSRLGLYTKSVYDYHIDGSLPHLWVGSILDPPQPEPSLWPFLFPFPPLLFLPSCKRGGGGGGDMERGMKE